jgi:hypothetical protein
MTPWPSAWAATTALSGEASRTAAKAALARSEAPAATAARAST